MDEYGVNTLGKVEWLRETNDEKDLLIAGAYRNRKGEVKGLRYDKDGNLRNHTIEVSKGVFTERSIKYKVLDGHQYMFTNADEAKNVFVFMAENTQVEWGLYRKKFENPESETYYLSTSHEWGRETVSATSVVDMVMKKIKIDLHIHSHPYDQYVSKEKNIEASDYDKNFARKVKGIAPLDIKFKVYSRGDFQEYEP